MFVFHRTNPPRAPLPMPVVNAAVGGMGSAHLTRDQADRLRAHIERETRCLQRMIDRMRKLRWGEDDPLWEPTLQAFYAMQRLRMHAMGAGYGDPPKLK
jgi:hypothetical protein